MDYKYIEQLLERYFQCETSLDEERILRTFFAQKDVPAALLPYRDLFVYEQSVKEDETLSEDFDQRILSIIGEQETTHVKARVITMGMRLRPLFKAVACVAIVISLALTAQMPYRQTQLQDAQQFAEAHKKDSLTVTSINSVAMTDSAKVDSVRKVTLVR